MPALVGDTASRVRGSGLNWLDWDCTGLSGVAGTGSLMGRISICLMLRENDQVSLSHGRAGCGSPHSLLIQTLATEIFVEEGMLLLLLLLWWWWCEGRRSAAVEKVMQGLESVLGVLTFSFRCGKVR